LTASLVLAAPLRERIAREARAAFPRECCGLLEGARDGGTVRIAAVHATRNLAPDFDRFEIDPMEQFALLRGARARGQEIVGCYHSHPNGRAEPSPRDLENAGEEAFVWLIVAVAAGEVGLRAFVYEGATFAEIVLANEAG
jgi:proteasome lid subunit RPN8/RPN11